MERVRGGPHVLEHVDHIEDDRDIEPELAGGALHALDLIALAIDQDDPAATMLGIRAVVVVGIDNQRSALCTEPSTGTTTFESSGLPR